MLQFEAIWGAIGDLSLKNAGIYLQIFGQLGSRSADLCLIDIPVHKYDIMPKQSDVINMLASWR